MLAQANALVKAIWSGPDAVEEESLEIAVESSAKENREQKELWREEAIGVARIFDWGGPNRKSHAMTSSETSKQEFFVGAKIS